MSKTTGVITTSEGTELENGAGHASSPIILSAQIAERGLNTGADFARYMAALMADLSSGRITPQTANACCNAGGKLLRIVEMRQKYGTNPKKKQPDVRFIEELTDE